MANSWKPKHKVKICGVYLILNTINGKLYIGSSINVTKRWQTHKSALRLGYRRGLIQSDYLEHGQENFLFVLLEETNPGNLKYKEQEWLNNCFPEYNTDLSAFSRKGSKLSEATKLKISIAGKGRKRTEETKRRISEGKKGKPVHTNESKTIISQRSKGNQYAKGHSVSEESRKRMSLAKLGNQNARKSLLAYYGSLQECR